MASDIENIIRNSMKRFSFACNLSLLRWDWSYSTCEEKKLVSKWPDAELSHVTFPSLRILSGTARFCLGRPTVKTDSSKWGNEIIIFNNCAQPDSSIDFWKAGRGAAGSSYYLLKALTVATVTRRRIEGICLRIKPLCVRGIFRLHKSYVFFTNVRQTVLSLHWLYIGRSLHRGSCWKKGGH